MNEIIALTAISSCAIGAILSTLSGWWNGEKNYAKGKLASSLIISVMASFSLVNFGVLQDQIGAIGLVGLVASFILLGFGTDQSLAKLERG